MSHIINMIIKKVENVHRQKRIHVCNLELCSQVYSELLVNEFMRRPRKKISLL